MVCQQVREHAKIKCCCNHTFTIGEENFKGIVDLMKNKLLYGMMIHKGRLDVVAILRKS
jgi:hypothetical protein